jgi:hypothetical protein
LRKPHRNDYAQAQKDKHPDEKEIDPRAKLINNNKIVQRYETTLVERSIRFEEHHVPSEYEPFAQRAAKFKDLDRDVHIGIPITFRSLRIAVEREKEFGGHLREWPDLREADEHIIRMDKENHVS